MKTAKILKTNLKKQYRIHFALPLTVVSYGADLRRFSPSRPIAFWKSTIPKRNNQLRGVVPQYLRRAYATAEKGLI
jgi:hypothetical protein